MGRAPGHERAALLFVLATAVVVAFGISSCVAAILRGVDPPREFRIEVVKDRAAVPAAAKGTQAWVRQLFVDGEPTDNVTVTGAWQDPPTKPPFRFISVSEEPASLTVHGRWIGIEALHHPWSGAIAVFEDGRRVRDLDLSSPDSYVALTSVGVPEVPWSTTAATLLGLLLLAAWLAPWRAGRGLGPWLVVCLSLVHLQDWLCHSVGVNNDSPGYLIASGAFFTSGRPGYFPVGYGLFMDLCLLIPALTHGHAIALAQHVLVVVAMLLLYDAARRFTPELWAASGALVGGALAPTLMTAQAAMSETLAFASMATVCWAANTRQGSTSIARAVLAGLAIATGTLARVVPFAVLTPYWIVNTWWPRPRRSPRALAIGLCTAALILGGAIANYWLRSSSPRLTTSVGSHLYNHFVHEQGLLDREGPVTSATLARLARDDLRDLAHWDLSDELRRADIGPRPEVISQITLEAASTASLAEHLWFDAVLTARNLIGNPVPYIAKQNDCQHDPLGLPAGPLLPGGRARTPREWAVWVHRPLWRLLTGLFCLATLLACFGTDRITRLSWAWLPWSYLFASSAVEFYLPRYNAAVAPVITVFVFASAGWAVREWRARRPRPLPDGDGTAINP